MAVRQGMQYLIDRVRVQVNDLAKTVWTDEEVQDALDRFREQVWKAPLTAVPTIKESGTTYTYYLLGAQDVEGSESGPPAWRLYDATGKDATGYVLYPAGGLVVFNADQGGRAYYADYRVYDIWLAAADLWEQRAAMQADKYDFGTGSDKFSRSQWFDHCVKMAELMRRRARPRLVPVGRGDVVP